jgi:hypothetical protein
MDCVSYRIEYTFSYAGDRENKAGASRKQKDIAENDEAAGLKTRRNIAAAGKRKFRREEGRSF